MTNPIELRDRLANPGTRRAAAVEAGDWARNTCLMLGSSLDTAYHVGGFFAGGIERSWSETQPQEPTQP